MRNKTFIVYILSLIIIIVGVREYDIGDISGLLYKKIIGTSLTILGFIIIMAIINKLEAEVEFNKLRNKKEKS